MTDICPDSYAIIRIGWMREPIGYKEQSIWDPKYCPVIMPEPVYSEPKRYIDIKLIDDHLSHEMRIWDDGSDEFLQVYADATNRFQPMQEIIE